VTRGLALLVLVLAGMTVSACGDTGEESRSAPAASVTANSNPDQTVPGGTTETATSTTPKTVTTIEPATTTTAKGETEPNAGDEEGIRVPAEFVLAGGQLGPVTVAVPAYLRIELIVHNRDAATRSVSFHGKTLTVPSGATKSTFVAGLRPGRYPVTGPGGAKATVVSGANGGP
jgi:hypothetical protein